MTNVLVLPSAAPLIHGVGEGDPCVGIGESERAAGAKVAERARVGTERALGHRELEPEPEARGALSTMSSPYTCCSVAHAMISGERT